MIADAKNEPIENSITPTLPDLTNLTLEQRAHLDYIWALGIIATRQIPTEIAPETASGNVGGKPYQLIAMDNYTANHETQPPTPGDASRYRFLRTARSEERRGGK